MGDVGFPLQSECVTCQELSDRAVCRDCRSVLACIPRCHKCEQRIAYDFPYGTDNGLWMLLSGGYGEFHDDLISGPYEVALCHECAHAFADWLSLDVHNWHTHRVNGGQHPDHHDGAAR